MASFTSTTVTGGMNNFGSSSLKIPLYDPRSVRENRVRFRRDAIPLLDRANSFYCPSGRWPSRGWILVSRSGYDLLSKYSTTLQLNIGDTSRLNNVATIKNLSIVQAQCVTRGLVSDPNAIYLVEVTDGRGVLYNKWFQFPLTAKYNIRVPGYPQTFYLESMKDYSVESGYPDSKTTWTWATMLKDIWDGLGTFLGAWPGLPYAPAGTPEGFWFTGVPAWTALCDILDYLGMTVAVNPTSSATPFTIVSSGVLDPTFVLSLLRYLPNLEDDLEWIDFGAARVPKTIKVLFRRRNSVYGTEETVAYRNDIMAQQWAMKPIYTITVTAPADFASAVGTHYIWSDFTVRYDDSSNPLSADVTTAQTIAQERVTQYFRKISRLTDGFSTRVYAGALPFYTGSQVDGVCWYQDYSNQARQGWKTKVVRGPDPPFPEIYGSDDVVRY